VVVAEVLVAFYSPNISQVRRKGLFFLTFSFFNLLRIALDATCHEFFLSRSSHVDDSVMGVIFILNIKIDFNDAIQQGSCIVCHKVPKNSETDDRL